MNGMRHRRDADLDPRASLDDVAPDTGFYLSFRPRARQRSGRRSRGDPLGLRAPPLGDALVVAGEQDVGNFRALPLARAGILGIFQQARLEALLVQRGRLCRRRPGSSRTTASISTIAASSPPAST